ARSGREHVYAQPGRQRPARVSRPAVGRGGLGHARRTIDCGARRSPALWTVAAQPVGGRRAATLAGHGLDRELAEERRVRGGTAPTVAIRVSLHRAPGGTTGS